MALAQPGHTGSFRQILADEAVGVLVRAPLPRMMRARGVKASRRARFDPLVVMELCAAVCRNGLEHSLVSLDGPDHMAVE